MTVQQSSAMKRPFSPGRLALLGALLALGAWLLPVAAAQAAPEPGWGLTVAPLGGGYFAPGANGNATEGPGYVITATNTGTAPTVGTYTITDTLPKKTGGAPAVTPGAGIAGKDQNSNVLSCGAIGQTVTCNGSVALAPGETVTVTIPVNVPVDASGSIVDEATVEGGGVLTPTTASSPQIFLTGNRAAWMVSLQAAPTNLQPTGTLWTNKDVFVIDFSNVGGASSSAIDPITVTLSVSTGLLPKASSYLEGGSCVAGTPTAQDLTCTIEEPVKVGENRVGNFFVNPGATPVGTQVSGQVTITGGGAQDALDATTAFIDTADAPFEPLPGQNGLGAMFTSGDGLPTTQAGSHPGSLGVQVGFPSAISYPFYPSGHNDGGVHNQRTYLPPGVIVNPQALVDTCLETQNEQDACPDGSAVGLADLQGNLGYGGHIGYQSPLFAIEAPPGTATSFSFDALGIGIYPHINGGLRPGGDYAIGAVTNDILAFGPDPILGFRLEFWGDTTDPIHDHNRGECAFTGFKVGCIVTTPQTLPLFSMPTSCGGSMTLEGLVDSWEHIGDYKQAINQITDSVGNPVGVTGCNALEFEPSLEARPTTTVADSPSGLSASLKVPQSEDFNTLASAHVKKAVVKLPEGMAINPAGANGLDSCDPAEIGIDPGTGKADGTQPTCPDASRIGTAEVTTPLLDHPMPGSVYLATPHDNPFDSMLALYVVVDDKRSGTLIKLAAEVEADPKTGQLTTVFDNQPQLPFDELKLNLFGGAAGLLRTPAFCGPYSSTSSITPWSGNLPSTPSDNYEISNSPTGGTCATSAATQPNAPSFDAGTIAPIAGASSPLVVNLRRADGTQQFSSTTVTPPPGLLGRLAGVPYCSQSSLDAAAAKTGKEETTSPSCPAASKVGTVDIGAGAGPAPYFVQGNVYLTGAYKGAPLSLAAVTPAVAGAYDLGTVVTRVALNIDPATAQITAVSDNLPTILEGIPLDIRSVQVKLDRPNFTFNPTSCNALQFTGQLVSTLGQAASLLNRFQVAECVNLGFKPSLKLRLKGATKRTKNPALIATYTAREGDANLAFARVKLPNAAFLDNSHIGTVCSRVQFAADQCPPDSIYGQAEATSPIVDYTVSGPVFLRANPEHELPDLVVALNGPASQPIEVDLAGKTDSVKGALRNTFEFVPDVPVSSFKLELFGKSKGLIELSRNLCKAKYRAQIELEAQNGKVADSSPVVASDCKRTRKPKHHRHHRRHGN